MKKIFTLIITSLIVQASYAQVIVNGVNLDINNVKARINNNGSLFWDPIMQIPYYEVPQGSNKNTIFTGNLWVGGYDSGNQLHVAAETYNQTGSASWWPGPLDISNATAADANTWNLIWKVNRQTILNHISNWNTPGYIVPAEIANWPGNPPAGTNYAPVLAPFFDSNSNQVYEPALGEFPIIYGDQAVYFIYNDNYAPTQLGVPTLKLEVHGMAFAFDDPLTPFMDNTVFIRYQIGNRSGIAYDSVAIALWTDADLGNASDDYFGTDVGRNMYYFYNADPDDDGADGYGLNPPAQGVKFLSHQLYSSQYYDNVNSVAYGNPGDGGDHYEYMTGSWLDGLSVTFGGDGRNQSNPVTTFMYPGTTDPAFPGQNWDMASAGVIIPGDMRGLGSVMIPTLAAGSAITFDAAYITAFPDSGGPPASIALLQQYADSILARYAAGTITSTDEHAIAQTASISINPNPLTAYSIVSIDKIKGKGLLRVTGIDGRIILEQIISSDKPVLLQRKDFAAGLYTVSALFSDRIVTQKLVVR